MGGGYFLLKDKSEAAIVNGDNTRLRQTILFYYCTIVWYDSRSLYLILFWKQNKITQWSLRDRYSFAGRWMNRSASATWWGLCAWQPPRRKAFSSRPSLGLHCRAARPLAFLSHHLPPPSTSHLPGTEWGKRWSTRFRAAWTLLRCGLFLRNP